MRPWRRTVEIKDLLGDDPCPPAEDIRQKSKTIIARFDAAIPADRRSSQMYDAIEEFDWLSEATGDSDDEMVDAFNDCLERLYDAADADRIWLGL